MFDGNLWIEGSPILSNFIFLMLFFTLMITVAQEDDIVIPTLDFFQTFISWPNFNEGMIITVCLWCFRCVERILGVKVFIQFLFYNFITYLPLFILTVYLKGFHYHYPFFSFVPFSIFIFIIWQIPSVKLFSFLTDKIIISLAFIFLSILGFPYSLFPLISAIIGNLLWLFDVFRLKKCTQEPIEDIDETNDDLHVSINDLDDSQDNYESNQINDGNQSTENKNGTDPNSDAVKTIMDMGFTRDQAINALAQSQNDIQRAIDKLLP